MRGAPDTWRPLTLSTSRTLNSLFAMFVPIGVLLLVGVIRQKYVDWMLLIVIGLGFASAILAMAQVLGPNEGPLYFYRITNGSLPVGLFANRNHHAIFLASLVPLVAYIISFDARLKIKTAPRLFILVSSVLFMVVLALMTGSRAGSLLIAAAIIAVALVAAKRFSEHGQHTQPQPITHSPCVAAICRTLGSGVCGADYRPDTRALRFRSYRAIERKRHQCRGPVPDLALCRGYGMVLSAVRIGLWQL